MKTQKMIAIGAGILFVLATIFSITLIFQNRKLNQSVVLEQSHGATLLAQKHALQKEIDRYMDLVTTLKGKNKELDGFLAESASKLLYAQHEINRLQRENRDKTQIQKKLQEALALNDELKEQLNTLTAKLEKATEENLALQNSLSTLRNENSEMAANLQMMQAVLANNFLIEALQGKKEKLTVRARRTGKIHVDFEIPLAIQSSVNFKIIKPDGGSLDSRKDKHLTVVEKNQPTGLLASSSTASGIPIKTKRIKLTYTPETKLRPGVYTIEVYNNDTYLGASQIKLK